MWTNVVLPVQVLENLEPSAAALKRDHFSCDKLEIVRRFSKCWLVQLPCFSRRNILLDRERKPKDILLISFERQNNA